MEDLSRQMAERKAGHCRGIVNQHKLFTKAGGWQKEKKKQKKKNVADYGKLKEFPTFSHNKQQQII